jgi:hypothetical protein
VSLHADTGKLCDSGTFKDNLYGVHLGPIRIVGSLPHVCRVERMEAGGGEFELTIESVFAVNYL